MITLYTPSIGFEDAEAKIAYGMARVALELPEVDLKITHMHGYYKVSIESRDKEGEKFDEAFSLLCSRALSSQNRYMSPGISPKYRENYRRRVTKIVKNKDKVSLVELYREVPPFESELFGIRCRHKEVEAFGGKEGGFILGFSGHVGKPYGRDKVSTRRNLGICAICGALSLLGNQSCSIELRVGKKRVTFLPIPLHELSIEQFDYLLSSVKTFPLARLDELPNEVMPLVILAMHPHLTSALSTSEFVVCIHGFEQQKGSWTTRGSKMFQVSSLVKFLHRKPFNQAIVNRLIKPPHVEVLSQLFNALTDQVESSRRNYSQNFARSYVRETKQLLYHETAKDLLIEVDGVNETLVKRNSIVSVARMLNYFVRDKNYGYVDSIRNARDIITFQDILAKALRTAQTKKAAGEAIHIPSSEDIQDVIEVAEKENLEEIKLSITLLALSYIIS
jgi:CRISPR type I-A-associated protein Csa5